MTDRTTILSPVGRMVQGDPFEMQTKDWQGKPLTCADGVTPRTQYFLGVAFPKGPEWDAIWAQIWQIGQAGFPGGQANVPIGDDRFAWKIADGDATPDKEGFAGHMVIKFSGGFAPKVYTPNGAEIITKESNALKRGDYVRVYFNCAGNGNQQMPGVYINPQLVERVGYGAEIVSGPDGAAVFGGAPAAVLPPGASPTPLAGAPIAAPGTPGMPATAPAGLPAGVAPPGPAPVVAAPPVAAPAAAPPGAPVTPAPEFLAPAPAVAGAVAPVAAGAPPMPTTAPMPTTPAMPVAAPVAPAGPVMTPAATTTYAEYIKTGWTDATLRANGLIV